MKLTAKIFSLLFVASLSLGVAAQTTTTSPRERLVLQIFRHEGAEPVYQEVPGSEWSPLFRRVGAGKTVRLPAPVQAVRVVSRLDEQGGARVFVSLLTGERFPDKEVGVTSFAVREGEEISVRELERYGVEPFRVVVLRRSPTEETPPAVVNKTRSIEAITAVDRTQRWPVKLVARNLSGRAVIGLGVQTMSDNRVMTIGEPHGEEGLPLIAPGGSFERHVPPRRGQVTASGYAPQQAETIVLAAAAFDDGSYEGEPEIAARLLARRAAVRVQLERALPLLRAALDAPDADTPAAVVRLKREVAALGTNPEPGLVAETLRRFEEPFPRGPETVQSAAEAAMHHFRKQLLDELTAFERTSARTKANQTPPRQTFPRWLQSKLDAYEKWLARL